MKCLIVVIIALVAFVAADEEWKPMNDEETYNKLHENCMKESGLSNEQKEKVLKYEYPDEKEIHEYVLCHVKGIGVFSDEGGYNGERVLAQFAAMRGATERARTGIAKCGYVNQEDTTPAIRAYHGWQCMLTHKLESKKNEENSDNN